MGKQDLFENGKTPFNDAMVKVVRSEYPEITKALDALDKKLPRETHYHAGTTYTTGNAEVHGHAVNIVGLASYPYEASGKMQNFIRHKGNEYEVSIHKPNPELAKEWAEMLTKPATGIGGIFNRGDNHEERKTKSLEALFERNGVQVSDAMKAEMEKLKDCVRNPQNHDDNKLISDRVLADQKSYEIASLARSGQLKGGYSPAHSGTAVIQAGKGEGR